MAFIHSGIQSTLVAIDIAGISNGDTADIYLNLRPRLFTFDSTSTEATKTTRPGPYYLRPHDYATSGVWVETIGNVYDVLNASQIITGQLRSTNCTTATGSEYDLDNATIKLGGTQVDAAGSYLGAFLGLDSGTYKFYVGDGANKYFKFDGTNISWGGANASLSTSGVFTATNAVLTGSITANSGAIGGWTLATTTITSTNIGLHSASAASGAQILIGHTTSYASAEIGFKNDGSGKLASGNIYWNAAGALNLSGPFSSSATITGGGFIVSTTGAIYSTGKSSYADTDAGFFLGYDTDAYKFNIGDAYSFLKWNGDYIDTQFRNITFKQEPAPGPPTLTEGAVGNLNGDYYYRITLVLATGETNAGTTSGLITVTNKKVELSNIPIGTEKCTARRIYRTTGISSTFFYYVDTINDNTTTTYSDNLADGGLGVYIPYYNTTGGNLYLGTDLIFSAIPGLTVVGFGAGNSNKATNNTFLGSYCGAAVTTGSNHVFIGSNAGKKTTTGGTDIFIGGSAGFENLTGSDIVAIGESSGGNNTTGAYLVLLGSYSGYGITEGNGDICIGLEAGRYQNDASSALQTPENSIYIGRQTNSGSDPDGGEDAIDNEIVIGFNATGNGAQTVTLGNTSIANFHCQVALTVDSDKRIKRNINPSVLGLSFINALNPILFQRKNPFDYPDEIKPCNFKDRTIKEKDHDGKEISKLIKADKRPADDDRVYLGLSAQQVEEVLTVQGIDLELVSTSNRGKKAITYGNLIMPLITAVQELSKKVEVLENRLN